MDRFVDFRHVIGDLPTLIDVRPELDGGLSILRGDWCSSAGGWSPATASTWGDGWPALGGSWNFWPTPRFFVDAHVWRRGRDSNPRWAVNPYSLSRGAPSAARPPLREMRRIPKGAIARKSEAAERARRYAMIHRRLDRRRDERTVSARRAARSPPGHPAAPTSAPESDRRSPGGGPRPPSARRSRYVPGFPSRRVPSP